MINVNDFTKLKEATPEIGCECLCVIEDEMGNVYYGLRSYDRYFNAFCIDGDEEKIIAWLALTNVHTVHEMLSIVQKAQVSDTTGAQ